MEIKKNIIQSWNYVKQNNNLIWVTVGIFLISMLAALILPVPEALAQQIQEIIKELIEKTKDMTTLQLIGYIFMNNLYVSAMGIFLGAFFCFVPVIIALSNGYVLGFVITKLISGLGLQNGIISLWRLFPHGIFEIPAVIISLALGMRLGVSAFKALGKKSFRIFSSELKKAFKALIYIVLPLLIIAAIIEGALIGLLG